MRLPCGPYHDIKCITTSTAYPYMVPVLLSLWCMYESVLDGHIHIRECEAYPRNSSRVLAIHFQACMQYEVLFTNLAMVN